MVSKERNQAIDCDIDDHRQQDGKEHPPGEKPAKKDGDRVEEKKHHQKIPRSRADDLQTGEVIASQFVKKRSFQKAGGKAIFKKRSPVQEQSISLNRGNDPYLSLSRSSPESNYLLLLLLRWEDRPEPFQRLFWNASFFKQIPRFRLEQEMQVRLVSLENFPKHSAFFACEGGCSQNYWLCIKGDLLVK